MRIARRFGVSVFAMALAALGVAVGGGCSSDAAPPEDEVVDVPGPRPDPGVDENTHGDDPDPESDPGDQPAPEEDGGSPGEPGDPGDPSLPDTDAGAKVGDAGHDAAKAPSSPATTEKCKKHITADFVVYTYLGADIPSNGCWKVTRTVQDHTWRDCHYPDGNPVVTRDNKGRHWQYDDTSPRHDLARERAAVKTCSAGGQAGYEYLAYRDDRWRIVKNPLAAAYFAELYLDEEHIDPLYFDGVWKHLVAHARMPRLYPMVNIGVPTARYPLTAITREVRRICSLVRDGGHLGLYAGKRFEIPNGSPRLKAVVRALDACTQK